MVSDQNWQIQGVTNWKRLSPVVLGISVDFRHKLCEKCECAVWVDNLM